MFLANLNPKIKLLIETLETNDKLKLLEEKKKKKKDKKENKEEEKEEKIILSS
ncbi:MAG: hypothetical protein N2114_06030 [Candidatus Goldbacteria bacterium]|nr:hypothetical protein [Candidatus Goldiibacteriota bacterium]